MTGTLADEDDIPEAEDGAGPGMSLCVAVTPELAQHRLDRLLALALPEQSRTRLKALIEEGHVAHGGAALSDPAQKVKAGAVITVTLPALQSALPLPQAIPLSIVFEDAHVIVIDKQAGLVVHPAAGNRDGTLVNALLAHCGASLKGIGGEARPGIVHRIDKDTSGLIVAAKTELALRILGRQFAAHTIERVYRACVWGVPRAMTGTISTNLARSPANRQKMAVVHSGGKQAVTHYKVARVFTTSSKGRASPGVGFAALLECRLETGRTHQVRVHLSHLGHPLIGDMIYGRKRVVPGLDIAIERQALHASVLGFLHPKTHNPLRFESPLPADFQDLIAALEAFCSAPA
jgi:23S rRNA pseudouridine1911/1915/1917 synthase